MHVLISASFCLFGTCGVSQVRGDPELQRHLPLRHALVAPLQLAAPSNNPRGDPRVRHVAVCCAGTGWEGCALAATCLAPLGDGAGGVGGRSCCADTPNFPACTFEGDYSAPFAFGGRVGVVEFAMSVVGLTTWQSFHGRMRPQFQGVCAFMLATSEDAGAEERSALAPGVQNIAEALPSADAEVSSAARDEDACLRALTAQIVRWVTEGCRAEWTAAGLDPDTAAHSGLQLVGRGEYNALSFFAYDAH